MLPHFRGGLWWSVKAQLKKRRCGGRNIDDLSEIILIVELREVYIPIEKYSSLSEMIGKRNEKKNFVANNV